MNRSITRGLIVCLSAISLASCQDYEGGFSETQIKEALYAKNFVKAFGEIDPSQDWNLATRGAVTVTSTPGSEIKIYAKVDGKYKIVGDYENFCGNGTLNFDMIEGTTDILVTNGMQSTYAKVGDVVNFSGTRAGHYDTTGDITVSEITDPNQWFIFDKAEAEKYQTKLPESEDNLGKVTQNFTFISNGEFTVYPIFWDTSNTDEIGIYFTDVNGYQEVPIYTNKSGNELKYRKNKGHNFRSSTSGLSVGSECPDHAGCKILHITNLSESYAWVYCEHEYEDITITEKLSTTHFSSSLPGSSSFDPYVSNYVSRGVKVNIPAGTLFGMYIKPSNGVKQYSQQEKNSSIYSTEPTKDVWAATFTLPSTANSDEDDMYLCFEDWQTSGCDKDLNDVVFRFYGTTPTVVDEDAQEWIICGEDLGGTFDLDYNDVVVSITHIGGKEKADFKALAAGGTLASYVYFDGTLLGEIHELLGAENAISGDYDPINVSGSVGRTYQQELIVVSDFSIATVDDAAMDANMGGFMIKVVPQGTASTPENATVEGQTIQNSWRDTSENVPYVFCVPSTWEEDGVKSFFRWPNELVPVSALNGKAAAYNAPAEDTFEAWTGDKSKNQWYKYPVTNSTTGLR